MFYSFCCVVLLCATAACTQKATDLSLDAINANNSAVGLMGQFRYADAEEVFSGLVDQYPDDSDLRLNLVISILNQQSPEDIAAAADLATAVLEQHPDNARASYVLGILAFNAGRLEEALDYFERVVERDPEDSYAAYFYAQSLLQQGNVAEALNWYERAIGIDPYNRSALYGAFLALQRLDRPDTAMSFLERYQLLADAPRAYLVEIKYTRMGPKAEAQPIGETVVVRKPDAPLFAEPRRLAEWPVRSENILLSLADINGDTRTDLFLHGDIPTEVWLAIRNGFERDTAHALNGRDKVLAVAWGDIDNDGRTDVYLGRAGANEQWNHHEGGWVDVTKHTGTADGDYRTVDLALFDADHDGDLDVFAVNADGPNELFNNNRDGSFRPIAKDAGIAGDAAAESRQVLIADLDHDRDDDIVVINTDGPNDVFINHLTWHYEAGGEAWNTISHADWIAAAVEDRNIDGFPELYAATEDGSLQVFDPGSGTTTVSAESVATAELALADVDGDGASELITGEGDWNAYRFNGDGLEAIAGDTTSNWRVLETLRGPAILGVDANGIVVWDATTDRYPYLTLALSGQEDTGAAMRSNASAIGTQVAARAGGNWTRARLLRRFSGPGQDLQPLSLGLRGALRTDYLVVDWPDGVYQTELSLATGELQRVVETQRQLASCPVLFAWNGERFQFISDVLGVGGIGFAIGPNEYAEPRPWEYFLIPDDAISEIDGRYQLKITEPMEEAAYVDRVRLLVFDLPPGWQFALDERMGTGEPFPTGQPIFYERLLYPDRVTDSRGKDVTAAVRKTDLEAADPGYADPRFIGLLAEEQRIVMEFDRDLSTLDEPWLLFDGWVEYGYSQTFFAAWQAGLAYEPPSLEARVDGVWQTVLDRFGYPAGMPRAAAVPLPPLPIGVDALALVTNQEIYFDRLALVESQSPPAVRRYEIPLKYAAVEHIGFPRRRTGPQRKPDYDFSDRLPLWDTKSQTGRYTMLGDATALAREADFALAIIGPGDSLHLEFEAPDAAPAGWKRHVVLAAEGWAKDMDLYTRDGSTLGPLPGEMERSDFAQQLHDRYNTRHRSGR